MRRKGGSQILTENLGRGPVEDFNPMSQKFVDDMNEFAANTKNPDIGGATYVPRMNRNVGINFGEKGESGAEPADVFVVGGAPQPGTGEFFGQRFPTQHVMSAHQFTASQAESGALRAATAQYQQPETLYSSGSWNITEEDHPRKGQVDLDIGDVHAGGAPGSASQTIAHHIATGRGEEEYVHTQGPGERFIKTIHSPTYGKQDPIYSRGRRS